MTIFKQLFLKKKKKNLRKTHIIAPISGKIIQLFKVPSEVFHKKKNRIVINPTGSIIVAPCSGTIEKISSENHSFTIKSKSGLKIFIHFTSNIPKLNSYELKNIIFEKKKVYTGEVINILNLDNVHIKKRSIFTKIIIFNTEMIKKIKKYSGNVKAGITKVMTITW